MENGNSHPEPDAIDGEGAQPPRQQRRGQRVANHQRARAAREAEQAAPPEPQQSEPMDQVLDYDALWQKFTAPFTWRVRNERLLNAVREARAAPDSDTDHEPSSTRSPGAAGLETPSPSRSKKKQPRRGRK